MKSLLITLFTLYFTPQLLAELYLPNIIHDHMVLQRNAMVPIWGWDTKDQQITVSFAGQTKTVTADANGKWMIELQGLQANSTPQSMTIKGSTTRTLKDILIGEVWLTAGQSNMEWTFNQINSAERDLAKTHQNNTQIRVFHASEHTTAGYELMDGIGKWKTCHEIHNAPGHSSTSAVGFFFALKLHKELNVPIGLLDINWGGMRIEPFIPDSGAKAHGVALRAHNVQPNNARYISVLENKIAHYQKAVETAKKHGIQIPVQYANNIQGHAENMIYKSMIAPTAPYAIQGAIWYQGESNRGDKEYFKKLQALQTGLSNVYRKPKLPFYQVQIAPYAYTPNLHDTTLCDTVWTAQFKAAQEIENIELIPSHDTNINIRDIHPQHKLPIGNRLADMALNRLYNRKEIAVDAPRISAAKLTDGKIIVSFTNIDKGLATIDGKAPTWFEESADGVKFTKVGGAQIQNNTVQLTSLLSSSPTHIRMGWAESALPNLKDNNGLPVLASPPISISP